MLRHPAHRQQRTCGPSDSYSGTHRSIRRVLRDTYPPSAQPRLESLLAQPAGFGVQFGSDRAQAHEVFPRSWFCSNLQLLWKPRENSATRFSDQDHILQPRSPESGVVHAGLNGQHLSIFQNNFLQARVLVNLQPKTMPGAVKESDAPPSAHLSRKTAFSKKFLDCLVNGHPIDSCLDSFQSERLTGLHCLPELPLRLARASAQNRSSHIAKISGLRIAWKNIEDNQRVCVKRTVAPFMRITCLVAAGDNRAARIAARAPDRRINFSPERFGTQRFAVPAPSFSGARFGRFQNFNRAFDASLRNSLDMAHH